MRETIARTRGVLAARLAVLEEEIRLAEALYKEGHGDFRYLTFENVALFERQINCIGRLRRRLEAMDLEQFASIEDFKATVLAGFDEVYATQPILRAPVRMVMECIRTL